MPPVDIFSNVEVAQFGSADRAAVDGLITHLDLDVFAAELVLYLVHDVGDGFHGFGIGAFAEVFPSGQKPDAKLIEVSFGYGSVNEVTERTRSGIDDHVVDIAVVLQVVQHRLEDGTLFNSLS
ncbi:hypothetical protein ASF98_02335 [Arthrobacter sp. Leaf337]|nr:hypothetical protein [Arthrobacter sp. Leaf337]KQR82859.1 hypothetical protein ASF98_02335 [Arthrobacter sp. Leaf337]